MVNNLQQFALSLIQQNPNVRNNPNAQELINVIQSGDAEKGQQIAKNFCDTYGITPAQALEQAASFFRL